jgi:hypothetical protein
MAPGLSGIVAVLTPDSSREALDHTRMLSLCTSPGTRQEDDVPRLVVLLASYVDA